MEFHICSSPRSFDLSTRLILFRKIGCHGHYGMLNHHKTISTQRGEIPNFHKVWNSPILKSTKREIQHFWCNAVERFGISSDRHISSSFRRRRKSDIVKQVLWKEIKFWILHQIHPHNQMSYAEELFVSMRRWYSSYIRKYGCYSIIKNCWLFCF